MAGQFVIGLGGGSGAGKTTLARELSDSLQVSVTPVALDNYYCDRSHLPPEERESINYDHPDAIDWDRAVSDVTSLATGQSIEAPQYDFETHCRKRETTNIAPGSVILVEGIYALYSDALLECYDTTIYVQTEADRRLIRRIRRDADRCDQSAEAVIEQYLATVKPMHERFVESTKASADVIVSGNEDIDDSLEQILQRVRNQGGIKAQGL
jgi:uridine kinase